MLKMREEAEARRGVCVCVEKRGGDSVVTHGLAALESLGEVKLRAKKRIGEKMRR